MTLEQRKEKMQHLALTISRHISYFKPGEVNVLMNINACLNDLSKHAKILAYTDDMAREAYIENLRSISKEELVDMLTERFSKEDWEVALSQAREVHEEDIWCA